MITRHGRAPTPKDPHGEIEDVTVTCNGCGDRVRFHTPAFSLPITQYPKLKRWSDDKGERCPDCDPPDENPSDGLTDEQRAEMARAYGERIARHLRGRNQGGRRLMLVDE